MALEYKRTPEETRQELEQIALDAGYTRLDRFIGGTIDIFSDTYADAYDQLDDLESQTRIDTASGIFLDGWGFILDEARNENVTIEDLSVDNVYITTSNGQPVTNFTLGGTPLFLPDGIRILDESGTPILATLDSIAMDDIRAFTRVVGAGADLDQISPGTYTIEGSIQDFVAGRVSGSVPRTQTLLEDVGLVAVVQRPIVGRRISLTDNDYRFVLFSKGRSINLANKDRINTLLSNITIARFVIRQFTAGSSSVAIYIEPTRGVLSKSLEESVKIAMDRIMPYGTVVHVARMVLSRVEFDVRISILKDTPIAERDELRVAAAQEIETGVLALDSGSVMNIDDIKTTVQQIPGVGDVFFDSIRINGRSFRVDTYTMRNIEKLFTDDASIVVDVI